MKNQNVYVLGLALAATMGFGACNGLKKMQKKADLVNYTVTPNPLEMHGDSVAVTIKVTYPPKYFGKKVVLTVTPSLGGKNFKPATLLGEKAVGTGTKIAYKTGGSFTYTDKQAYTPEMKNTDFKLAANGAVKSKSKDVSPKAKIGDGTIVTPLLVKPTDKTIIGKDDFKAVLPRTAEAQIFFVISQSTVRPTEMNNESMKAMKAWVGKGMNHRWGMEFKGCDVSAYASPDGEMSMNANLANDRAKKSSEAFATMFKDKKMTLVPAQAETFYSKVTTAEDWDGFKRAMEASSIKDKDLVLRVLSQYPDGEVREKEIKNMAKTYTEIANDILPKLRRSVMTMKADEKQRPNDNILMLAKSSPDSLSVEEILYAATLTKDMNEQLSFYKAAEKKYPGDWRTSNNVGCMYLQMNKLQDAKAQFEKALAIDGNNKIVNNNMGIVYRWMGDRVKAMEYYKKAAGAGSEVSYNMGIVQIQNGAYADAVSSFGGTKDFNAALAKLLNGSPDDANTTLDGGSDKEEALSYYLRAIISARKGDAGGVVSNLGKAIAKDASLKEKAKEDMEFLKWRENAEFKSAVN